MKASEATAIYEAVYGIKHSVVVEATEPVRVLYPVLVRAHTRAEAEEIALAIVAKRWQSTKVVPVLRIKREQS